MVSRASGISSCIFLSNAIVARLSFLSPLALSIWLLVTQKKAKKQRDVLERLYRRGELKTEDAIAAGLLKKQSISQKPAAAEPPIANPEEKPQGTIVTEKPPEVTSPPPEPVKPKKEKQPISAISILLAVGVTLVIIAGLLFVRSTWETLSDGGRLAVLGAGSLLFFGASALANRVWHLKRTGAAFFTLGTAFFPISVWAAGSFALLGKGLAGASNPWLLSLAAASFTILACLAVRKEKQIGWSIAVMAGFSVTYACLCRGIIKNDGVFFLAITAYVLLLAYAVKPLAHKFPPYISKAAELFAIAAAFCAIPLLLLAEKNTTVLFGIGALMLVAAFLSESIASRLKMGTAFVACGLVVCGFAMALHPFYRHNFAWGDGNFSAFIGILTAVVMMTLHAMERNSKAEQLSYRLAYYVTAGFSQVALWSCVFDDGQLHWLTYPAEIVLLLVTLLPVGLGFLFNQLFGRHPAYRETMKVMPGVAVVGLACIVGGVVSAQGQAIVKSGALIFVGVFLHNALGYVFGYTSGVLARFTPPKKRTIAIEVGMQNAGLATVLATKHFPALPEAVVASAVSCIWHSISGALLAGLFNALDRLFKNDK